MIKQSGQSKWRMVSRFHQLADEEIIASLESKSNLMRACRLDDRTRFLIIQIPKDSEQHNDATALAIQQALANVSVPTKHYQFDDDWYIYIFLADWIHTDEASELLTNWLKSKGFAVGPESIDVLCAQGAFPLPLQPGFTWRNEKCQLLRRREECSLETALKLFLDDMTQNKVAVDQFVLQMGNRQLESSPSLSTYENTDPEALDTSLAPADSQLPDFEDELPASDSKGSSVEPRASPRVVQLSLLPKSDASALPSQGQSRSPPEGYT